MFPAIALLLLFYAWSLALIGACVAAAWGLIRVAIGIGGFGQVVVMLAILSFMFGLAAIVLLWSLFPRRDNFTPPGPRIHSADCPQLFEEIRFVAEGLGQPVPEYVYLLPQMNAFVSERGGWCGFGRKRVIGLGLPLLASLSVGQLRGVLAHEFAHFGGGDTRAAYFVYKTRSSIARTIEALSEMHTISEEAQTSRREPDWLMGMFEVFGLVKRPLIWFARPYLHVSSSVSRQQEFAADAVAARLVGGVVMQSALLRIDLAARAYETFVSKHLWPVLRKGYRPPVVEGFEQVLKDAETTLDDEEESPQGQLHGLGHWQSHPPTSARIRALAALPDGAEQPDGRAIELLPDIAEREKSVYGPLRTPIPWNEAGTLVFLEEWKATSETFLGVPGAECPYRFPCELSAMRDIATDLIGCEAWTLDDTQLQSLMGAAYGAVIARRLWEGGYELQYAVGAEVEFVGPGGAARPFAASSAYASGAMPGPEWRALLRSHAIPRH